MIEIKGISGEAITAFVRDLCQNKPEKPVMYYLQKYGISYEDYQPLSYAALPAMAFKAQMALRQARLRMLIRKVRAALRCGESLARDVPDMDGIFAAIREAIREAEEPYAEEYLNDMADKLPKETEEVKQ